MRRNIIENLINNMQENIMEENEVKESKPTYEQLVETVKHLRANCEELYKRLQDKQLEVTLKRLEYLFKVIEFSNKNCFSAEFIANVAEEIETMITIPEQEDTKEDGQEG